MTTRNTDPRTDRVTIVLGTLAGAVSAWGWYSLMVHQAGAPALIAWLAIGCFELFVLGLAHMSVRVANDGDSPAPYTAGIVLVALAAMVLQFSAAITEGWGWIVGAVLAMAPLAAITLWVSHIRRVFRLRGRAVGTVAPPASTIELSVWVRRFRAAWAAKGMAVLDRTLSSNDALILGIAATRPQARAAVEPPARVARGLQYEDVVPELRTSGQRAVTSGPRPDVPGHQNGASGHPEADVRSMVPPAGWVAGFVRSAVTDGDDVEATVRAAVEAWPGVNRDTVRRAYARATT
jgi:hypothetical protein